jgi:hypothetical protein
MEDTWRAIDETGIFGRNLELFFPLLLSSYMLNNEIFLDMINIGSSLNKVKGEDEFAESKDVSLIEFISQCDRYRFEYVFTSDLFAQFKNFIGNQGNDDESRWLNTTWFGCAIKRLKLFSDRKRAAKGQLILINVDKAKEKLKIFKVDKSESSEAIQ